jgi:TolB protein
MRRVDDNGDGRIDDADAGGDEIYLLDLVSGQEGRLTTSPKADTMPAWSPLGGQIAFVSDRSRVGEIYVMPDTGGAPTRLTSVDGYHDWFPDWSPDGKCLVFTSNRSGNFEIWTLCGDTLSNLTKHPGDDHDPAWSH